MWQPKSRLEPHPLGRGTAVSFVARHLAALAASRRIFIPVSDSSQSVAPLGSCWITDSLFSYQTRGKSPMYATGHIVTVNSRSSPTSSDMPKSTTRPRRLRPRRARPYHPVTAAAAAVVNHRLDIVLPLTNIISIRPTKASRPGPHPV